MLKNKDLKIGDWVFHINRDSKAKVQVKELGCSEGEDWIITTNSPWAFYTKDYKKVNKRSHLPSWL